MVYTSALIQNPRPKNGALIRPLKGFDTVFQIPFNVAFDSDPAQRTGFSSAKYTLCKTILNTLKCHKKTEDPNDGGI